MEEWRNGGMEEWRNGEVERWRGGEVERWSKLLVFVLVLRPKDATGVPPPASSRSFTLLAFRKSVENVHFWLNTMDFAAQPSGANVGTGTRWAIFVSF